MRQPLLRLSLSFSLALAFAFASALMKPVRLSLWSTEPRPRYALLPRLFPRRIAQNSWHVKFSWLIIGAAPVDLISFYWPGADHAIAYHLLSGFRAKAGRPCTPALVACTHVLIGYTISLY